MSKKLLRPEHIRDAAVRRYNNQHKDWLMGGGEWPYTVALGVPSEAEVIKDLEAVRGGPSSFRVEPNSQNPWSSSGPVGMWAGCL